MPVDIYKEIVALRESGKRGALATIVETRGSTPRKPGTKILLAEDGSLWGTIGGGKVEALVIAAARTCIATRQPILKEITITEATKKKVGMICGGAMKVFVEPIEAAEELIIFGGGHVSYALFQVCKSLDFLITVTDDREEFADKKRFRGAKAVVCAPYDQQFSRLRIGRNAYVVIATRQHDADELCLRNALKTEAKYLGMLGSRGKWAAIKKHLRDSGAKAAALRRVHCPIGLNIGAITPEEIAVSIAAELIQCRAGNP
jgi:xanthine dehydrogenase accessory factor